MKKSRFGYDKEIAVVRSLPGSTDIEAAPIEESLQQRIMSLPLLKESLPYYFADGAGVIDHLSLDCSKCGEEIPPDNIRGVIEPNGSEIAKLEGFGLCFTCKTVTPVTARFFSDGACVYEDGTGWSRTTWGHGVAPSRIIIRKLSDYVGRNWATILPPVIAVGVVVLWWVLCVCIVS